MENISSSRIKLLLSLKSKELEEADLGFCSLKILINKLRCCYCIVNEAQTVVALFDFEVNDNISPPNFTPKDFVELVSSEDILTQEYKSVNFAIQSPYQCIVAKKLQSKELKKQEFELCVPPLANNEAFEIFEDSFNQEYNILYSFPDIYKSLLNKHFKDVTILNSHAKFATSAITGTSFFSPKRMYLNVYGNNLEIVVSEGNSLLFANTFQFINEKDFLYHILSVGKMKNFVFEEYEVFLSGFLAKDNRIFKKLSEYAHRLVLSNAPKGISFAEDIEEKANSYQFINLYSL